MPENKEDQILSLEFRKKVIKEMIDGDENIRRKNNEVRKHEIYRDRNAKWVIDALHHEEFNNAIRMQMENRVSNISICKKVVNKIARTYNGGVIRKVEDDKDLESIGLLEKELDFNSAMKKADRYRKLFANTMIHPVPIKDSRQTRTSNSDKFGIKVRVLAPWEYDVIEDEYDLTKPSVVIVTDFPERFRLQNYGHNSSLSGSQGVRHSHDDHHEQGNRTDETIADTPSDKGTNDNKREFIWWSDKWHFTTNSKGQITDAPFPNDTGTNQVRNPVGILPFINVTQDQDCQFWAEGGDDIVDTSVLVNKILTDINFVTYLQGWGQMVITGRDLPNKLLGGPGKPFMFEVKEGDPVPQVFFASSNPPIQNWLDTAKSQLAMMLSTNDLAVRQIATQLDVASAASGIALLIESSELLGTQQDIQQIFRDKEPEVWEVLRLWHSLLSDKKALVTNLQDIAKFEDSNVQLVFMELNPPITEKEKLEAIEKRKSLNLNTKIELLQKDNPNLTNEEAEKKLEELKEAKEEGPKPPTLPPPPPPPVPLKADVEEADANG